MVLPSSTTRGHPSPPSHRGSETERKEFISFITGCQFHSILAERAVLPTPPPAVGGLGSGRGVVASVCPEGLTSPGLSPTGWRMVDAPGAQAPLRHALRGRRVPSL